LQSSRINYIKQKENIAKERDGAKCSSKRKKDDSPKDEVGSKRDRQQAKRAKTSKPELLSPSPPRRGFRMLRTGEYSSEDEEDYTGKNVRATHAKAKVCMHSINPSEAIAAGD
jgi:hypothetical protein